MKLHGKPACKAWLQLQPCHVFIPLSTFLLNVKELAHHLSLVIHVVLSKMCFLLTLLRAIKQHFLCSSSVLHPSNSIESKIHSTSWVLWWVFCTLLHWNKCIFTSIFSLVSKDQTGYVMICNEMQWDVTSSQSSASHWRYIWFWIQSLSNTSGGAEPFSNDVCCLFNQGTNNTTNLSRFWNSLVYTGVQIIISQQHLIK